MKRPGVLALSLGLLGLVGCGGGGSTVAPIPQPLPAEVTPQEFLLSVTAPGVVVEPLANLATGTLNAAAATSAVVSNGRTMALTPNGQFAYVANGSATIAAFTVNPATGALTPNGSSTSTVTVNGATAQFGGTNTGQLAVNSTGTFLVALNGLVVGSDVQVFPINSDGTLGTAQELLGGAQVPNVFEFDVASTRVNGQDVVLLGLAQPINNLLAVNLSATGTLSGTIATATVPGRQIESVAFSSSGGTTFANAITNGSTPDVVAAVPVTETGGNPSFGTVVTAPVAGFGQVVVGNQNGQVFASNGNGNNLDTLQIFSETVAGLTLESGGTSTTSGQINPIALDPSGNGAFLYVGNNSKGLTIDCHMEEAAWLAEGWNRPGPSPTGARCVGFGHSTWLE